MGRNANGRSSIYENAEGWHGRVTVGVKDNGCPDRRHVRGKTKAEVTAKVRKLEKLRDEGRVPKAGQRWRVAAWLTFWVDNIAVPPNVSENTHSGYSVDVRVHLIPGIGAHWLDKLEPEHVEKLYAKMQRNGSQISYEAACQASALSAPDSCPVMTWFAVVCGGSSGAHRHGLRATGPERCCGWS